MLLVILGEKAVLNRKYSSIANYYIENYIQTNTASRYHFFFFFFNIPVAASQIFAALRYRGTFGLTMNLPVLNTILSTYYALRISL